MGSIPGLASWVGEPSVAVAVVKASNCSSDLIPSPGTSICFGCGPKKKKKKKKDVYLFEGLTYIDEEAAMNCPLERGCPQRSDSDCCPLHMSDASILLTLKQS